MKISFKIPSVKSSVKLYELLFVFYFWGFLFLRPLLQFFTNQSTLILFFYILLLLSIIFSNMIIRKDYKIGNSFIFIIIIFILFLIDAIFRNNTYSFKYLYNYIYCGFLPVIFLSKVKDTRLVLYYFTWTSLFVFILFGFDPINGFSVFSDYMDYGFNLGVPVFIGLYIGYKYFKINWILIFLILNILFIIIYANKSSILTVFVFVLLYNIIIEPIRKKTLKWILLFSIISIIIFLNIKKIILLLYNVVVINYGINSYSLKTLASYFVLNNERSIYSGRMEIWDQAKIMMTDNFLFGHGIGSFQARYGFYSHNIVLDFLLFFGIIGLILFICFILYSSYMIIKSYKSVKLFGFFLFSLWFPKLFFSTNFTLDIAFWCFLSFPYIYKSMNNYQKMTDH